MRPTDEVLFIAAHGSRHDGRVTELLRAQAAAVLACGTFARVVVGALNGTPSVEQALDQVAGHRVVVVPLFASHGWYSDHVLPQRIRDHVTDGTTVVRVTPPVGTHAGFAALVRRRAQSLVAAQGWLLGETTIIVIGHGTERNPANRLATEAVAASLAPLHAHAVHAAFLDEHPTVSELSATLSPGKRLIIQLLTGGAPHTMHDVPDALGLVARGQFAAPLCEVVGDSELLLDVPMGQWPELAALIEQIAVQPPVDAMRKGAVHLVGAGPGDPKLITMRGAELLREADVVVYDRLASPILLAMTPPACERIDVGKKPGGPRDAQDGINALLIEHARAGKRVVRLKGGDPYIYGRGGEELAACVAAGIQCEVVPGITSAIAGPAAAGIPVTLRGVSRSFAVLTAHDVGDGSYGSVDLAGFSGVDTLVLLMGRASLRTACAKLQLAGRDAELPVLCVQHATLPTQRTIRGTLATIADIADAASLESPMVTVIGEVAAFDAAVPLVESLAYTAGS